jgi:hypothetical protein
MIEASGAANQSLNDQGAKLVAERACCLEVLPGRAVVDHEGVAIVGLAPVLLQPGEDPAVLDRDLARPHEVDVEQVQDALVGLRLEIDRVQQSACHVEDGERGARHRHAAEVRSKQRLCGLKLLIDSD